MVFTQRPLGHTLALCSTCVRLVQFLVIRHLSVPPGTGVVKTFRWTSQMYKWLTLLLTCSIPLAGCVKPSQQASAPPASPPAATTDADPFANQESQTESTPAAKTFNELDDLIESTAGESAPQPAMPPFDPPLSSADAKSLLEQCLQLMLTDSRFKHSREFYGTVGDSTVILTDGHTSRWPADFKPVVDGFDFEFPNDDTQEAEGNRVLGILSLIHI